MRRKLILSWSEAVVITAGNLLTIFLFAFNKKRPARKSLFLVMNMAFADLLLGGVCLPLFVCVLATRNQCSSSFSYYHSYGFIAGFVYHHRCFDISWEILRHQYYWPLKHRILSTRAYTRFIWTAWILAILVSTIYVLPFLSPMAVYSFTYLYGLFLLVTICGQNIGIWRKFQQKIVPCHQNRAMQIQRLTKPLSIVSVVTLSSLIKSFCNTQHIVDVLHDFGFAHIFFQFFCQSYGVRIENSCV